jgi:sortase A
LRPFFQRGLLALGLVCCGIWLYAWLDSRWFELRQSRRLEQLSAEAQAAPPAAQTDALSTFVKPGARPAAGPAEGELIGRVEISRLGVSALLLEGTSPLTLQRGAGHIRGTSLPGAKGNVGIAGHRDSFFRGLKDVTATDRIELRTPQGIRLYRVLWSRIVPPEEIDVLADTAAPSLTLVTCYPFYYIGAAPQRFVVRARQIDTPSADGG